MQAATQTSFNLQNYLAENKKLIENYLEKVLQTNKAAKKLWQAMNYSSLNGGKRLRGILCLTAADSIEPGTSHKILPIASGIECIHTMSLIHDDLPCMDDDDLRRGKPTCHKKFDEATALLAGDALLVEGINLCLKADLPSSAILKITQLLTEAIGADGMTGGQQIDLDNTGNNNGKNIGLEDLEQMHRMKTGVFLEASVLTGGLAAEASESQINALSTYAKNIGLAFQIADDLLDLESDSQTLGKTAGKDEAQNKATYPKLMGVQESKEKAQSLIVEAKQSLREEKIHSEALCKIADYVIERKY